MKWNISTLPSSRAISNLKPPLGCARNTNGHKKELRRNGPLCFHTFTNSSTRNPFVSIFIRAARCEYTHTRRRFPVSHFFSAVPLFLCALCVFARANSLLFSLFPISQQKTTRVYPHRLSGLCALCRSMAILSRALSRDTEHSSRGLHRSLATGNWPLVRMLFFPSTSRKRALHDRTRP